MTRWINIFSKVLPFFPLRFVPILSFTFYATHTTSHLFESHTFCSQGKILLHSDFSKESNYTHTWIFCALDESSILYCRRFATTKNKYYKYHFKEYGKRLMFNNIYNVNDIWEFPKKCAFCSSNLIYIEICGNIENLL